MVASENSQYTVKPIDFQKWVQLDIRVRALTALGIADKLVVLFLGNWTKNKKLRDIHNAFQRHTIGPEP